MAENTTEIRRIVWSDVLPFLKLARTPGLALNPTRLLLAFIAVVAIYLGGRILDALWGEAGGVARSNEPGLSALLFHAPRPGQFAIFDEIEAFTVQPAAEFTLWKARAAEQRGELAAMGRSRATENVEATSAPAAGASGEGTRGTGAADIAAFLQDRDLRNELATLRGPGQLERIASDALQAIAKAPQHSAAERERLRREALADVDALLRLLTPGTPVQTQAPDAPAAVRRLLEHSGADSQTVNQTVARFSAAIRRAGLQQQLLDLQPRGPFISLLEFEMRCVAAMVQGVLHGRWGFGPGVSHPEPTLLGSVLSAAGGLGWLVTQRPWYCVLFLPLLLTALGLSGGAICRSAALAITREHALPWHQALGFAREKLVSLIGAPLMFIAVLLVGGLGLSLGGLFLGVPWLGDLLGILFFPLALLIGLAMALALVGLLLGVHLTWPTIAVESSDGFDAMSRSAGYLWERVGAVAGYLLFLLLIGAPAFLLVRLVAALTLKLTHAFAGAGMDSWNGVRLYATGKLSAIWHMPAWNELAWLPTTGDLGYWGNFHAAPLGFFESLLMWFIALYVFVIVGLVGAYVLSFYFCGGTLMYLLLRKDVDATDWDEVYFVETDDEFGLASPEAESTAKPATVSVQGTSLPVLGATAAPRP